MHIAGLLALLGFPPMDENLHDNGCARVHTPTELNRVNTRHWENEVYYVVKALIRI